MPKKTFDFKSNKNSFFISLFALHIILLSILFAPLYFNNLLFISQAKSLYTTYPYAKIEDDGVLLFKTNTSLSLENAYFEIPKTYYVLLISNIDNNFYRAQYRDVIGYVLKTSVTPVEETPDTPYLENVTFRVYSTDGTNIFSKTTNTSTLEPSNQVEVLETIDYYGKLSGDEYIENRGRTWYYGKSNSNKTGYFYAGLCDNLSTIIENNEPYTPIADPFADDDTSYLYSLASITPALKITLVLIITLPAFAIVFLLFSPMKTKKKLKKQRLEKDKYVGNKVFNKIQKITDDEPL